MPGSTADGAAVDVDPAGGLASWCEATATVLGAVGATIVLSAEAAGGLVVLGSGSEACGWAEIERDLGEGPSVDAYALQRPILSPDIHAGVGPLRWPALREAVGVRLGAVLAFPLSVGAAEFGVLTVYFDHSLGDADLFIGVGLSAAEHATRIIVEDLIRAGGPRQDAGSGASRLSDEMNVALGARSEVFQAQGMIMVDLGVTLVEAMARLRGHAFSTGQSVRAAAVEVVNGLVLTNDRPDD